MSIHSLPTQFAPAERTSQAQLKRQSLKVAALPLIRTLFDAVPDVILILNSDRQIVFANRALFDFIDLDPATVVIGLRPGEVLGCIHSAETEGGCGTTEFCRTCGAAQAALAGLQSQEAVEECRIILRNGDALDLQVFATPLTIDRHRFIFYVLKDISHEKRRQMLEHVFFHDFLNSAGAIRGLAEVLQRAPAEDKEAIAEDVLIVCDRLIDEIKSHKQLAAAENDELYIERTLIHTRSFLEELIDIYRRHEVAQQRSLLLDPQACDLVLVSDRTLLRRVMGNMIKNALEACHPGEIVTLGCHDEGGQAEFWVHNPGVIPDPVRLQIFQRSFSTKGAGRGLGTYSIKLLGERYLNGEVGFSTSPEAGTVFRIRIPVE